MTIENIPPEVNYTEESPPKYRIGEIALDKDGIFWVLYYGEVAEQGGCYFGLGRIGFRNIDDALNFLKEMINKNIDEYKTRIEKKEK